MKADVWFDKDVFKGIEEDDDLEEADVEAAIDTIKKKGGKLPDKKKKKSTESNNKKKKGKKESAPVDESSSSSDDESSSDSESDFDENEHYPYRKQKTSKKASGGEKEGFEVVPVSKPKKKRPMLSPEELALGQELVSSKKRRRELEETAWNRSVT